MTVTRRRGTGKYGVAPKAARLYHGRVYDSKAEMLYAIALDAQVQAGEVQSWDPQYAITLTVNGRAVCTHIVDFLVLYPDGRQELHEVKGKKTDYWNLKKKLFDATWALDHPEIPYRVIAAWADRKPRRKKAA